MNRLDFDTINAALDPERVVPMWVPEGQKRGAEWVAANPTRADHNPGSFSINLRTGVWKDFATNDAGSDLVSLYAYIFHNDDQGAAARELADSHGIRFDAETRERAATNIKKLDDAKPAPVFPVPADAPQHPDGKQAGFSHPDHGKASRVWAYRDGEGRLMMYVARYDVEPRKQIIPWSWCFDPKREAHRWAMRGITGKGQRPLYGLERLAALPEADVILVEGEKAADAGQEMMDEAAAVVTWMGGVETSDRVNVKPLEGRRVILFPDFDALKYKEEHPRAGQVMPIHEQPGVRAMMALANQLKGVAREVLMVNYTVAPENHGWDLADGQADGWNGLHVLEYIGKNAGDPWHIAIGQQPAKTPPAAANTPATVAAPLLPLDASVNPFGYPHMSDKGQPLNTVENLDYLLGQYGISAKYNQVRKQVEVSLPGRCYTVDNRANCGLAELASMCARNRMPQSMLQDYVKLLADRNVFNPVCDWIASMPWDGVSRMQDLFNTVQVPSGAELMRDRLIYRWMLSAVAAIFSPRGFESHGVLVFTGSQGQGKTKWIKRLVPDDMDVVLAGLTLDPSNKDSVTTAVSHWLVELGELDATFRKSDIARLKSFVTQSMDKLRRPYDRIESEYQRRTVFFASVNESKYLVDDTGNRRWWTVQTTAVDYEHQVNVQQVWAEILVHFHRGERYWLTREEQDQLQAVNEEHEATDPIEEQVLRAFAWDDPRRVDDMTATEVLLAIGFDKPNKSQATHASKVLRKITGTEARKTAKGRFFAMPPRVTKNEGNRPW